MIVEHLYLPACFFFTSSFDIITLCKSLFKSLEDANFSMCMCTGCLKGETSNYYYYYYYNQDWIKNKMHHFVVRCFRMNGITQTQVPAVRKKYISNLYPSSESGLPHYTFLPANCRSSEMQYHIHTFCLCELLPPILNLNFKKLLEMLKDVNI